MTQAIDVQHLRQWVGKTERTRDLVTPFPFAAMAAILDRHAGFPENGDPLPYLWHWLYFLTCPDASDLGPEGHAKLGGFLPPVPLPRRMWAGSRFEFGQPFAVGETMERESRIKSVDIKRGKSGTLGFVVVGHTVSGSAGGSLEEEHDIVYRAPPDASTARRAPVPAPGNAQWSVTVNPDAVMLFRYSAVTFNAHRIHFDRDYCRDVEGYDGLVVHGPLIATLLLEHAGREFPGLRLRRFKFRAVSPTLDTRPFQVSGRRDGQELTLWASGMNGELAMQARAEMI